jgi:hypothetical protein
MCGAKQAPISWAQSDGDENTRFAPGDPGVVIDRYITCGRRTRAAAKISWFRAPSESIFQLQPADHGDAEDDQHRYGAQKPKIEIAPVGS